MKKTFILVVLLINTTFAFTQKIYEIPQVDERVELMSIVFRLAEANEYVTNKLPMYINEVDKYFEKYKNHKLIEYTKTLRNEYGVAYDAVAKFAVFLEIKNNKIKLRQDIDLQQLDKRWNRECIPKYIVLLNGFYKKTKFNDFFVKNEKIRKVAEENFAKEVTDKTNFDWFENFFGWLPAHKFRIIISLANGNSNYASKIIYNDSTEEYYAIIGSGRVDKNGLPIYIENMMGGTISTLTHEICHSFCNPLIYEYLDELLPKATIFNNLNREKMISMAYGDPKTFLCEILARACVIQYQLEYKFNNHKYEEAKAVAIEVCNGFLYVPQLLSAFERYKADRTNYKTLRDFMPEIVKVQNSIDPQQLYNEVESKKPIIIGTNIENGSNSVDCNLDHITVYFDRKMFAGNNGTTKGEYAKPKFTGKDQWNEEGTEWTVFVELEPDTQYQIKFPNVFFVDYKTLFNPKDTYILTFKTKPAQ